MGRLSIPLALRIFFGFFETIHDPLSALPCTHSAKCEQMGRPVNVHRTHISRFCDLCVPRVLFTFGNRVQYNALRGSWMVSKNQQKIAESNSMPSLPIVHTQVTLTGNVGTLDIPRAYKLFTFGTKLHLIAISGLWMVSKKSPKNSGSQWYAQSAQWAHTGHVKKKCVFPGRSYSGPFTFGPIEQGNAQRGSWMVSKNQQK